MVEKKNDDEVSLECVESRFRSKDIAEDGGAMRNE